MPSRTRRARPNAPILAAALALTLGAGSGRPCRADGPGPAPGDWSRKAAGGRAAAPGGAGASGGWWFGTAGVGLALALCGWASVAARRYRPAPRDGSAPTAVRVVGRTSLSPRHSVYLLDVGGRVLVVGTGPQGPPSLLGELGDGSPAPAPRFDHRLGDAL